MPYERLERDVDVTEEVELRRLEGGHSDAAGDARGSLPCAAARAEWQPATAAGATSNGEVEDGGGQTEARAALVTGYTEHRASLQDKKNYRRAIKVDLKLPEASTALAGVPRRKDFQDGDEGRQAWRASFNRIVQCVRGRFRVLARVHGAETTRSRKSPSPEIML